MAHPNIQIQYSVETVYTVGPDLIPFILTRFCLTQTKFKKHDALQALYRLLKHIIIVTIKTHIVSKKIQLQ